MAEVKEVAIQGVGGEGASKGWRRELSRYSRNGRGKELGVGRVGDDLTEAMEGAECRNVTRRLLRVGAKEWYDLP